MSHPPTSALSQEYLLQGENWQKHTPSYLLSSPMGQSSPQPSCSWESIQGEFGSGLKPVLSVLTPVTSALVRFTALVAGVPESRCSWRDVCAHSPPGSSPLGWDISKMTRGSFLLPEWSGSHPVCPMSPKLSKGQPRSCSTCLGYHCPQS